MNESCVRIYDNVVSDQWCKDTINLFKKSKNPSDDERYESPDFNQVISQSKSFTEICLEGKDEWIDVKNTFLNTCQQHFHKFIKDVGIEKHHLPVLIDTENVHFKKYEANGLDVFKNHVDVIRTGPLSKRFLVFIMYLSDVEEGGETSIPRYDVKCKPKAAAFGLHLTSYLGILVSPPSSTSDRYIIKTRNLFDNGPVLITST